MPIGGMLRERGEQYVAHRDLAGTWRILDTWNDALGKLDPDSDVPDDHDAVTILSEGAYHSLTREAARIGVLKGAAYAENEALEENLNIVQAKLEAALEANKELKAEVSQEPQSETYMLKESALQAIIRVAALEDISSITKTRE
tara:strand:+ start:2030 stop:2461 length:432 start_codon:yes stop_codon:yes gene_type:complete